jgi:hypothetical protein
MAANPYASTGWWNNFVQAQGPEAAQRWVDQQTGGGGADAQRNAIAQALMPTQALSGGTIQYSAPRAPSSQPLLSDAEYMAMGASPTDIMLFKQVMAGKSVPTGVAGPYGGGAMGQPQIPSGYNAFSGAGLPATNIGQGGLTDPGAGGAFAGGGMPPPSSRAPTGGNMTIGVPPSQGGQYGGDPIQQGGGLPTGNPYMFGYGFQPGPDPTNAPMPYAEPYQYYGGS